LQKGDLYTARLTLDITPAMRARIKVSAFTQGVTVAELLRGLLERSFPGGHAMNASALTAHTAMPRLRRRRRSTLAGQPATCR
jgi:membrane-associated phospholipid phosphatase